jgi:hypothetical protein
MLLHGWWCIDEKGGWNNGFEVLPAIAEARSFSSEVSIRISKFAWIFQIRHPETSEPKGKPLYSHLTGFQNIFDLLIQFRPVFSVNIQSLESIVEL